MSGSNCWYLTCIQVSQETSKVVWYSHLFKNFPVCYDPHSQRLQHSQWSRSRCFFWNSFAFSMIQQKLAIWSLVPLTFLNPACTSASSQFMHYWSLAEGFWALPWEHVKWAHCAVVWTLFGTTLLWDSIRETWVQSLGQKDALKKEMAAHSNILAWKIPWTEGPGGLQSIGLQRVAHDWATNTFHFRIGMKTDIFYSCGYCWVFQIYWHIEGSTFTASSSIILNSSAGILSLPLALFLLMLPKAT